MHEANNEDIIPTIKLIIIEDFCIDLLNSLRSLIFEVSTIESSAFTLFELVTFPFATMEPFILFISTLDYLNFQYFHRQQ